MQKFLAPVLSLIAIVIASASFYAYFSLNKKVANLDVPKTAVEEKTVSQPDVSDFCSDACKEQINKAVASAVATISASPKTIVKTPIPNIQKQTIYIPLGGPVSTTSTQWVDVPGVEVYIDKVNDYSPGAYITWEASLTVKDSNGQAFARLQDVTHGITVNGSEISTTNNSSAQTAYSGSLSLWAGKNLYRLQLKSLNSYETTFLSGRIKVSY